MEILSTIQEIKHKCGDIYENGKLYLFTNFKVHFIIGVVCLIIGFACGWYVCRENLYVDGIGNESVVEQFERVRDSQSETYNTIESIHNGLTDSINRVDSATERTDRIESTVGSITERNSTSEELIDRSTEIIRQSKSILETVREREENN